MVDLLSFPFVFKFDHTKCDWRSNSTQGWQAPVTHSVTANHIRVLKSLDFKNPDIPETNTQLVDINFTYLIHFLTCFISVITNFHVECAVCSF